MYITFVPSNHQNIKEMDIKKILSEIIHEKIKTKSELDAFRFMTLIK